MHHNGQVPPLNVVPDLAAAMTAKPEPARLLGGGYYDFATPYWAAYYTSSTWTSRPRFRRTSRSASTSGHMIYLIPSARAEYKNDWTAGTTKRYQAARPKVLRKKGAPPPAVLPFFYLRQCD